MRCHCNSRCVLSCSSRSSQTGTEEFDESVLEFLVFYPIDYRIYTRIHEYLKYGVKWAASCKKVHNGLSRCHTKRRMVVRPWQRLRTLGIFFLHNAAQMVLTASADKNTKSQKKCTVESCFFLNFKWWPKPPEMLTIQEIYMTMVQP